MGSSKCETLSTAVNTTGSLKISRTSWGPGFYRSKDFKAQIHAGWGRAQCTVRKTCRQTDEQIKKTSLYNNHSNPLTIAGVTLQTPPTILMRSQYISQKHLRCTEDVIWAQIGDPRYGEGLLYSQHDQMLQAGTNERGERSGEKAATLTSPTGRQICICYIHTYNSHRACACRISRPLLLDS